MAALPYFDEIDPSTIDVLLVTQPHSKASFMTHAMKAIYKLLLSDYVKVSKVSVEDMLYDEQDILCSMDKIELATSLVLPCLWLILLVSEYFTLETILEEDRHLHAAEIPQFCPDTCIIESTYGVQLHQPRHVREKRFTDVIHSTISQGAVF
ncbi:hypothetical protein AAG906_037944 [Vitis piasezkii]